MKMANKGKKIKPPKMIDLCNKSGMSVKEINSFLELLKRSMESFSKRIKVKENGTIRYYNVERKGIGILKTKYGKFWQYNFSIDDEWNKYSVIVKAGLDKDNLIPMFKNKDCLVLRIDSGCETGQVFGDLTCECRDQLHLALKTIEDAGEGMIINIPHQDGRGMGLTLKLATLWIQDVLKVNTVESACSIR